MKQTNLLSYYIMSVLAGGINFSFNLFLLKKLGSLDFKNFSLWFTYVSSALFLATLTQYFFFYSPLNREKLKSSISKIIVSLVVLHSLFFIVTSTWALAILSVFLFMAIAVFNAFFQRHLSLWKIGALAMIGAVSKYGLAYFAGPDKDANYYCTIVYASALLSFIGCLFCFFVPKEEMNLEGEFHTLTEATHGALVMAFFASLFPQLDFLIISTFKDQQELIAFSRIVVLEKIIFFAFLIYNQMLIALDNHAFFKKFNIGRKSEWLLMAVFLFFFFFGEGLLNFPLRFLEIAPSFAHIALWALLHALLLCLIFLKTQSLINLKKVKLAYFFLFILVAGYLLATFIQGTMGPYLQTALVLDSVLIIALYGIELLKGFSIKKRVA